MSRREEPQAVKERKKRAREASEMARPMQEHEDAAREESESEPEDVRKMKDEARRADDANAAIEQREARRMARTSLTPQLVSSTSESAYLSSIKDLADIEKWCKFVLTLASNSAATNTGNPVWRKYISDNVKTIIVSKLKLKPEFSALLNPDAISDVEIVNFMRREFNSAIETTHNPQLAMQKIARAMDVTVPNPTVFNDTLYEVLEAVDNLAGRDLTKGSGLFNTFIKALAQDNSASRGVKPFLRRHLLYNIEPFKSLKGDKSSSHAVAVEEIKQNEVIYRDKNHFTDRWTQVTNSILLVVQCGSEIDLEYQYKGKKPSESTSGIPKANRGKPPSKDKRPQEGMSSNLDKTKKCTACGRLGHVFDECRAVAANMTGVNLNREIEWINSEAAKPFLWDKVTKTSRSTLPFTGKGPGQERHPFKKPRRGNVENEFLGVIPEPGSPENYQCKLNGIILTNVLFDTGALQANYGSLKMRDQLVKQNIHILPCTGNVCSCFGDCKPCVGRVECSLILINKSLGTTISFIIEIKFIDIIKYDLIIGRQTLMKYKLVTLETSSPEGMGGPSTRPVGVSQRTQLYSPDAHLFDTTSDIRIISKESLIGWEPDRTEEGSDPLAKADWLIDDDSNITDITIAGSTTLQDALRDIVEEFKDVFNVKLAEQPAQIREPLELNVDITKWAQARNRTPPRPQSPAKQAEIKRQIELMLAAKIIQRSYAGEFSQVLLTPKPNDAWRFCIDFRALNDATRSAGWPIPNIRSMFQRIGSKRPKYFGTMDLTSGYHQMPMAMNARIFTAFITFMGIFEFLRVPFGLKGAPSFFQRTMETLVLAGLIYIICEIYIDDIIIFGKDEIQFLENLRQVLLRLRNHKIRINPRKTKLGLQQVEYVGHMLSCEGLSFSREKRSDVFQTPLPKTVGDLRSFLGLANWFRDHIQHHSTLAHPMQSLIGENPKGRKVSWTPEAEAAFYKLKQSINDCPKLFFLTEGGTIILQTDASDYGIGAILFQIIGDEKRPIAFVSKSMTASQIANWPANEKEAYAIWFSMTKLEYLLRDVHFRLQTDHRNLTFISLQGSPRVRRWKLAIQEFDFDIEYIKGADNMVADRLSRDLPRAELSVSSDPVILAALEEDAHIPSEYHVKISKVHNTNAGHHGVDRTLAKLRMLGEDWTGMRGHVRSFIRKCPCCQKMRELNITAYTTPYTLARYEPMERLNIDSVGPLPADNKGNTYIIVIIDCFTRFVELYPVVDLTANPAAVALLHHMGRYGAPCELQSDNGAQFVNDIISEFLKLVGTDHRLTLAYSHEENGIVERANKAIMTYLRAIIFDRNVIDTWSECLPLVQRIYNANPNVSLGNSPSSLLFGNAITLDRGIFLPHANADTQHRETMKLSIWASNMLHKQKQLIELAQQHQQLTDAKHLNPDAFPKRARSTPAPKPKLQANTEFAIGSYVLIAYRDNKEKRPPHKLLTKWRGPLRVVNKVGSTYTLQDLVLNKLEDVHVTQIKLFQFDPESTDPRLIANRDHQAWDVEKVLGYTGDPKKRKTLEFLIHWKGHTEQEATWQPWANVRLTDRVIDYLKRTKGLKYLVNKKAVENSTIPIGI